ncbi:uncharacterized protein LOC121953422 [Plectropomus leopardus]|uniref:uncharacterized protein LOC121953422 n=1 Tax=Plectropomus leopardus TaxID=160734 RepID=UPI001C4AD02D|nr:uncharacterized protein LOC121953422 [Plectropomus leopardus]
MAEVRLRLVRGTYNFAHKTCNRHLLESQNKHGKGAIQTPSLSAGFLLGGTQYGDLYGAEKAADTVTVGVSQDGYTRVTPLFGAVWENRHVADYNCNSGLNREYPLSHTSEVRNRESNLFRCQVNANFRRTFRSARRQQSLGLCWRQFVRAYSGNGAQSEPLYKTKTGYYDILEVSPAATQAQIKTAYYKQSFVYHPDRNAGSEDATVRFSEISEAYSVLGNKALRKKYDRGLLSQSDLIATARPSAKSTGSSARPHAESKRSVMGTDSRGGVFDFDKFFKAHYSEQLQRQRDIAARKEEMLRKKQERIEEKKMDFVVEAGAVLMLAMAVWLLMSLKRG